jgi:hypothetical protein
MKPIRADFSGFSIMPVTRGNDTMKIETNPPPFFFFFRPTSSNESSVPLRPVPEGHDGCRHYGHSSPPFFFY